MSDKWMTVAEAAATLKVHPRTIERRIAGRKIESRRADDGQLQVCIDLPDAPDTQSDIAMETVRELAADQVTLAKGSASALVKFAHDDAMRAREDLAVAQRDVGRARQSAMFGWCVVAAMGIAVCFAVGWATQNITAAKSDVRHLNDYAAQLNKQTQILITERDTARQQAADAATARAEAAGRLAAYVEQASRHPTSQPTGFLQRLASALSE